MSQEQQQQQKPTSSILNWVAPGDSSGEFKRQVSTFRDQIEAGPNAKYPPEKNRYHLYVSYACPWAHRTLILRKLKGLEDFVSFTALHWHMEEQGWRFATEADGPVSGENVTPDPLHPGFTHLRQIYFESEPEYSGRFTVPALYDKKTHRIVNNESADIIRMFGKAFDSVLPKEYAAIDLFPKSLEAQITEANEWIYNNINNGVYKSGFATTQEAYEKNVKVLFESLDRVEARLEGSSFFESHLTETDVRLYTTIVRFDPVYVQHFKNNLRDIRSGYPAINRWLKGLYWNEPAFNTTTNFEHIKKHYTKSHKQINPLGITPLGPIPDIEGKAT